MATREEIVQTRTTETDTRKNQSYCPHYERDTCLIHFKCCDEEDWYPCHKCHNEAVALIENLQGKAQKDNNPSTDHSEDNFTSSDISEEREYLVVGVSSPAESSSELEGVPGNKETEAHDAKNIVQATNEENDITPVDPPAARMESKHLMPTEIRSEAKGVSGNEETEAHDAENIVQATNEENDITPVDPPAARMESKHLMPTEIRSEAKGLQDVPTTSGQVEETKHVADRTSDEPSTNKEVSNNGDNVFEITEENSSQTAVDAGNTKTHPLATALDGTRLKCTTCKRKQRFAQNCECGKSFASFFCGECKLLIESKVDPYHCDKCGICRGNKGDHFHCDVCNVCMALSLKGNHKCYDDRGHDPCAICWEEVFTGAVIFPCFHMVHKDCAEKLVLSGSHVCPMCRNVIFQDDEDAVTSEETSNQFLSSEEGVSRSCRIGQKLSSLTSWVCNFGKGVFTRNVSSERDIEMANV